VLYIFGLFLIYTAYKMLRSSEDVQLNTEEAFVITRLRKIFPITGQFDGARFLTVQDGARVLTPLAVALVLVETMDLLFALDSIPATFAITTDPFLVFTSNVFAILGLRSLYFVLAGIIERFRYLKASLSAILGLIGLKMLFADLLKNFIGPSFNFYLLGIVVLILAIGAVASIRADRRDLAQR
jgi:tellurite resistance protein TerC